MGICGERVQLAGGGAWPGGAALEDSLPRSAEPCGWNSECAGSRPVDSGDREPQDGQGH